MACGTRSITIGNCKIWWFLKGVAWETNPGTPGWFSKAIAYTVSGWKVQRSTGARYLSVNTLVFAACLDKLGSIIDRRMYMHWTCTLLHTSVFGPIENRTVILGPSIRSILLLRSGWWPLAFRSYTEREGVLCVNYIGPYWIAQREDKGQGD